MFIILYVYSFLTYLPIDNNKESQLRKYYLKALEDKTYCDSLYIKSRASGAGALAIAYESVSIALRGKYTWSPAAKLSYLGKYEERMKQAIKKSPEHTEVRFLRYSVEKNIPAFLSRSKHLDIDKKFLMKKLQVLSEKEAHTGKWKMIAEFIYKTTSLSAAEKQMIRSKFNFK